MFHLCSGNRELREVEGVMHASALLGSLEGSLLFLFLVSILPALLSLLELSLGVSAVLQSHRKHFPNFHSHGIGAFSLDLFDGDAIAVGTKASPGWSNGKFCLFGSEAE